MSRDRFVETVGEAILALPQDLKTALRVVEDPELQEEGRVMVAGTIMHVLSAATSVPGVRGVLQMAGDVVLLRLAMERIAAKNPEGFARHRDDSPGMLQTLGDDLAVCRAYLGESMRVLDRVVDTAGENLHQGHSARGCVVDTESSNWLYDTVHEAIVEQFELDEDEVARELKQVDRVLSGLESRLPTLDS